MLMPIITITEGIQTNNKYIPSGTSPIKTPHSSLCNKRVKKTLVIITHSIVTMLFWYDTIRL